MCRPQALLTILFSNIGGWYEKGGMIGWDAQTSTHAGGNVYHLTRQVARSLEWLSMFPSSHDTVSNP
jgi:hypothetical protein